MSFSMRKHRSFVLAAIVSLNWLLSLSSVYALDYDGASQDAIFSHHGRSLISRYADGLEDKAEASIERRAGGEDNNGVVGIIGAGVGGLYSALILQSLNISFEIIEASDRIGGRLHTYKFEKGGKYDYFDLGAMRYPLPKTNSQGNYEPGVMQRVGQLFNYLGMQEKLIPYYYASAKEPGFQYFNGIRQRIGEGSDFNAPALGIDAPYIKAGPSKIIDDVVGPFAQKLFYDLQNHTTTGWDEMMRNDTYSTRAYMSFKYLPNSSLGLPNEHLRTRVINWVETFDKSTGWYDRALTETVLEAIAFGQAGGDIDWKCIDGGSSVLPETMVEYLSSKVGKDVVTLNAPVTAIGLESNASDSGMVVNAGGKDHKYSHVISTIPLPVLRTVDLSRSKLDIVQENALRQLQYGPSIKVGVLFNETWWTNGKDQDGKDFNIVGGQSFTDLPIRTVVYPSYGVNSSDVSKTLIASYCWTDDAERMGSLIGTGEDQYQAQLENLILSNLAAVHNVEYSYLKSRMVDMYSWDWNHNPLTMGAFAFFGPGNFEDMYTSLNRPAANDRLHFVGEALSIRHAWVVGALDSAWRGVYSYLVATNASQPTVDKFFTLWGRNPEWFENPSDTEEGKHSSLFEKYLRRTGHHAA
ncbi:hypothetical protein D9613_003929 [Agrocybe pediades]|uniref:Amine oxidase domain-containing protein n=1 Tax=Agrocybe pediades TaxID=84607 RepID=A0A8H4QIL4_9AGAR|nr:hypothetical protein D9613_003929 [Agrocybe pediades]